MIIKFTNSKSNMNLPKEIYFHIIINLIDLDSFINLYCTSKLSSNMFNEKYILNKLKEKYKLTGTINNYYVFIKKFEYEINIQDIQRKITKLFGNVPLRMNQHMRGAVFVYDQLKTKEVDHIKILPRVNYMGKCKNYTHLVFRDADDLLSILQIIEQCAGRKFNPNNLFTSSLTLKYYIK